VLCNLVAINKLVQQRLYLRISYFLSWKTVLALELKQKVHLKNDQQEMGVWQRPITQHDNDNSSSHSEKCFPCIDPVHDLQSLLMESEQKYVCKRVLVSTSSPWFAVDFGGLNSTQFQCSFSLTPVKYIFFSFDLGYSRSVPDCWKIYVTCFVEAV